MKEVDDHAYGIVVVRKISEESYFLLIHLTNGYWGFPKGHLEGNESPKEASLRELKEETGIIDISLINAPHIVEKYDFEREGILHHKINHYLIGFTQSDKVTIQPEEVIEYKWLNYNDASKMFVNEHPKKVLDQVQKILLS